MLDKRKWFDAPDSKVIAEDGATEYFNVEGRFADHPVLNPEKSHAARHNVYDVGIVLHARVKKANGDVPAQRNLFPYVLRFDKGDLLSKEDFAKCKRAIARFPEAWAHYQLFRQSPVTDSERLALRQLAEVPHVSTGKVMVDKGGVLVPFKAMSEEDPHPDDDDEMAEEVERVDRELLAEAKQQQPAIKKRGRPKKTAEAA